MTEPTFDRRFWEDRWSQVLRDHSEQVARRPPNEWLMTEVADLEPGVALDAGCGHGSDTLWLAARGWRVTAVDFSAAALAHARSTAEGVGGDVAGRIDWVEGDLSTWTPQPAHYDLVVSLYVHMADSVEAAVQRLAAGVAPGGTLFMVGHQPIDPTTGAETAAAGQVQVSVDIATAALDPNYWTFLVAEDRPRSMAGTGVDAVIRARRHSESISATTVIDAPVEVIFAVLADPAKHAAIDGTGWVCESLDSQPLTAAGQTFRMAMYHENHPDGGYQVVNQVQAFDPPSAISWKPGYDDVGDGSLHFGGWTWRYDLDPAGPSKTKVTLTYDWSAVPESVREYLKFPPFAPDHLGNSLSHLAQLATT